MHIQLNFEKKIRDKHRKFMDALQTWLDNTKSAYDDATEFHAAYKEFKNAKRGN